VTVSAQYLSTACTALAQMSVKPRSADASRLSSRRRCRRDQSGIASMACWKWCATQRPAAVTTCQTSSSNCAPIRSCMREPCYVLASAWTRMKEWCRDSLECRRQSRRAGPTLAATVSSAQAQLPGAATLRAHRAPCRRPAHPAPIPTIARAWIVGGSHRPSCRCSWLEQPRAHAP